MAHSLVPPTPGPLFVAGQLGIDIGMMILLGIIIGIFTSAAGYLYAWWASKKWIVPVRETADVSLSELKTLMAKEDSELPAFGISILPIVIPVFLIAGNTILKLFYQDPADTFFIVKIIEQLGDSNIALAIAAATALIILAYQKRASKAEMTSNVYKALASAGVIILITASGGAFGNILQQTAVGPRIQELAGTYKIAILPLAFFVTVMIRTAQGSATVAMITAVSMLSAFADPVTLGCHPVYLAMIIGCGSKLFPWMNDSGFWLISRMSGMTESETLKTFSMTLSTMAIAGLIVVLLLSRIFPLV